MSSTGDHYVDEKSLERLPPPAIATPRPKRPSFCGRLFKFAVIVIGALMAFNVLNHGLKFMRGGCHGIMNGYDDGHQHPFPPIDKWKPFNGTTHFELEPAEASGLTVKGSNAFGKVVFETSKLSNKVVIDLDIKTNMRDEHNEVSVKEENGYLTINTPHAGKLETYASAKIQIPSNIIGTFVLPTFEVNVPRHMVDFNDLPESLEIGSLTIRVAKGFVKPGPVHTNTTKVSIADGALHGTLTHARQGTDIDVARGNVTLDISSITSGNEGRSTIHIGNGHLKGNLAVYNSTSLEVGRGSIYVTVDFKHADTRAELSSRIASGDSRVYVASIAAERTFDAYHNSIAGDQLITYPSNFQGTIDARDIAGSIKLAGKDLDVEKVIGGMVGKQGDSQRNSVSVKAVKGALDILVGDEDESE